MYSRRSKHICENLGDLWLELPFSKAWQHAVRAGETEGLVETTVEMGKTTVETTVESSVENRSSSVESSVETHETTPNRVLVMLEQKPHQTLEMIARELGLTVRAVEKVAKKLIESGRLRRVGPKKGGHWEVIR